MTSSSTRIRTVFRVFGVPAAIAILTGIGLISGVLGDGIWDVVSWIALAVPLLLIAWHALKPAV